MNKCFITKLPSSVDNDNLPVLGQLRINWLKQNDLTDNDQRYIELVATDSITVKVSGAHFTDSTLSSNLGNTKTIKAADGYVGLYVSNDANAVLTIDNKYSLSVLNFIKGSKRNLKKEVYFDIDDIEYCTNLERLILSGTKVNGDISAINKLTSLTILGLSNTQVRGDIGSLSKFTKLSDLRLEGTQVSGDISALSNLTNISYLFLAGNNKIMGNINTVSNFTNIRYLDLTKTQVSGDISAVSNLTNIELLSLTNTKVSGDISALSNLTNISYLSLQYTQVSGSVNSLANLTKLNDLSGLMGCSLTGDISRIPANVRYIALLGDKINTNFTWTANGRKNATLLAMYYSIPFDTTSMDNMLIDQATCTVASSAPSSQKVISVRGTRTAASDAAVAAIQNKGITITGVTKQA